MRLTPLAERVTEWMGVTLKEDVVEHRSEMLSILAMLTQDGYRDGR